MVHTEHPGLPYWWMTIGYGRHVTRALIAWGDESPPTLVSLEDFAGFQLGGLYGRWTKRRQEPKSDLRGGPSRH